MSASGETWRLASVEREIGEPESVVRARTLMRLGLGDDPDLDVRIVRRSIDARGQRPPRFVHAVDCHIPPHLLASADTSKAERVGRSAERQRWQVAPDAARPVVIGAGPCGIFAALVLAEAGLRPILLDRGKPVETRAKDVSRLMGYGIINPESNLCFGEGGAGTWSDGKLYTRKGGDLPRRVLQTFVAFGADPDILVEGRPHLGTDKLVSLLKSLRAGLVARGGEIRFEARVDRLAQEDGRVTGVILHDGERIDATHVVLALGHSARDLYLQLANDGLAMLPKAFAVGFRVEHTQALVNRIQYGQWAETPGLPAAYYELTANVGQGADARGVYSFCMCPGGSIVPTGAREGEVCVNGMSHSARSGHYANSALVVTVSPEELGRHLTRAPEHPVLVGMQFQRECEERAAEAGGGGFTAPAQRLGDYLADRPSSEVRRTTYRRGVVPADLGQLYPDFVRDALRLAMRPFSARMPGYTSDEAVLIGVETRTSAPVTISRDPQTLTSPSLAGLYPAGEGAGFAGGIVSAGVDGIRVAEALLRSLAEPIA